MKKTLIPLFCFIIVLTYGSWKLSSSKSTSYEPRPPERHAEGRYAYGVGAPAAQATSSNIRITVIQGNIPQEMKWDQMASDRIVGKYLNLTSLALAQSPDLVIWPEAAFPLILKQENGYAPFADLVKKFNKPLLAGTVTSEGLQYHNSVLLVSEKGRVADSYRKIHLVPFGEYIPLRGIFGFLETVVPIGDFFPGTEYTVFAIPRSSGNAIRCGTLICFEDVFPGLSRQFVLRGAGILINMTNDAWFRKTSAPYQHLSASVFRAVENRVPVVRAANTGVSGFIAPSGKIISLVQDARRERTFIDGILTESVAVEEGPLSFYTRYGDVFIGACASFIIISLFASYIKYQKSKIKYKP
jgi:apolipoprotein N-acyltransferase